MDFLLSGIAHYVVFFVVLIFAALAGGSLGEALFSLAFVGGFFTWLMHESAKKQWYIDRRDGEFCKSCGAPTYMTRIRTGFDSKTGNTIWKPYRDCPNTRYGYKVDDHPRTYDF